MRSLLVAAIAAPPPAAAACNGRSSIAYGEAKSIVAVRDSFRDGAGRAVPTALEPRTSAVRDDRTDLVDTWLYRRARDRYEYMIQPETILDSFACGV